MSVELWELGNNRVLECVASSDEEDSKIAIPMMVLACWYCTIQDMIKTKVYEKLKEVIDPELGIDIVSLGFIYEVRNEKLESGGFLVKIVMTLTTPGCPLAGVIDMMVKEKIGEIDEVEEIEVEMTFDPPWTREMMSEEAKLKLGMY